MASEGSKRREAIAHFEIVRLAISIVIWCLLAWFLPSLRHSAFDDPTVLDRTRLVIDAVVAPVILVVWAIMIVRHVGAALASRWVALWVEDGRLVHAHRKTLDMPLGDIVSVELVTENLSSYYTFRKIPLRLIVIKSNDGKPVKLAVSSFREPADEVVSRIRREIVSRAESAVVA